MRNASGRRTFWLFAALVLVIAAETRFLGLSRHSLWFDEAFSVAHAKLPLSTLLGFLRDNDTHPPLYYALLGSWVHFFGAGEVAVRSLSAIVGFLAVPLLYVFARDLVDAEVALAAAALLAGSALAVVASQEARMYPILGLLALLSWLSLRQALHHRHRWGWAAYVGATVLMLYTHYFGFFVLGAQVVYLAPLVRRDRTALLAATIAVGTVLVCFLPWLPAFLAQAASGRPSPTFRPPVGVRSLPELIGLFGFGGELLGTAGYFHTGVLPPWQAALIVLPFAGLLVAGVASLRGERAWCLLCYWAVPIVLAAAVSMRTNVFYGRYFSFLAPPFALLMACGVDVLAGGILRRAARGSITRPALAACLVAVLLLANAPVLNGYRWHGIGDYDWRGAAALVTKKARPNDYLLFVPGFARVPFEYYYRGALGRQELTPVETYRMVSIAPPNPTVDRAWARRLAEAHPRLWIIATSPVPGPAFLRLETLFGDSFASGQVWDFNEVYIFSLRSRRYAADAASR